MTLLAVMLVLALAVAMLPILAELLRSRVPNERAPGRIAQLPQGATHYQWSGKEDGPVIVCIHGLSTPSYVFAATERSLAALGYRVLSYDLYGRGFSARAQGRQDIGFFARQLRALLKHQEVQGPVSLLGFSMGGQIAAAFAAGNDGAVNALILVAPAGLKSEDATPQPTRWTAPLIGDWMTRVFGGIAMRRELVEHRTIATIIPDLEDRQAAETRTRGFLPAVLSSRRHVLSRSAAAFHRRIAEDGTPVLAIWGNDDPVIPLRDMGQLARFNPRAHHVQIKGAGHNLLQTHPSDVAEALRDFLSP